MSDTTLSIIMNLLMNSTKSITNSGLNKQAAVLNNNTNNNATVCASNNTSSLILQAPKLNDVLFFNETLNLNNIDTSSVNENIQAEILLNLNNNHNASNNDVSNSSDEIKTKKVITPIINKTARKANRVKKKVTFPEDERIIKGCQPPPVRGWIPGMHSTSDLLDSYLKSCERHKCKPLAKLMPQLKALQDLDCVNGEKVNVLNLKSEKLDSRQIEALEEVFKRLSFKTIDLESSQFEDDNAGATLFEILEFYDTCERLILANNRSINILGWQSLSKYIRKTASLENLELRGHSFQELIYFTYLARSIRLTMSLRILHLENSNIQGRFLIMLAAALKDNEQIKEIYLGDNRIQSNDGQSIATIIKENKHLELIDLKNNNLQDIGLSHICSGLSEQGNPKFGLKALFIANNYITANGIISYLSKALIHNRSLTSLNISQNTLTNEAIYELKEALIVNKQISCLILNKIKITDEGVIALAEYIAETQSLRRLDLRENDIRLGGLMALASSIKFNKTLNRLDLDREPKKDTTFKDSIETSRRLIQDINEYCLRNKRVQQEREAELKELMRQQEEERKKIEIENEKKLYEIINEINNEKEEQDEEQTEVVECEKSNDNSNNIQANVSNTNQDEDLDLDVISHNDELLKKILNKTNSTITPYLLSPVNGNSNPIKTENVDEIIKYFNLVAVNEVNGAGVDEEEEFQIIENDLNFNQNQSKKLELPIQENDEIVNRNDVNNTVISNRHDDLNKIEDAKLNNMSINETSEDQLVIHNEVLDLTNTLVSLVVNNLKTDGELLDKSSNINNKIKTKSIEISNKNQSNSIEEINESVIEESKKPIESNLDSSTNNLSNSACDEEDSDIEVLTVSNSKTNQVALLFDIAKQNQDILQTKNVINSTSKANSNSILYSSPTLLSSITETNQDILENTRLNQKENNKISQSPSFVQEDCNIFVNMNSNDYNKNNSSSSVLIFDDSTIFSNTTTSPIYLLNTCSTPKVQINKVVTNKNNLVNYSLNSATTESDSIYMNSSLQTTTNEFEYKSKNFSFNSDNENSIILATTPPLNEPANHVYKKQNYFLTSMESSQQQFLSNQLIDNENDESIEVANQDEADVANSKPCNNLSFQSSSDVPLNNVDSNNIKPFFASKLTSSQLSEELSHEIGLFPT